MLFEALLGLCWPLLCMPVTQEFCCRVASHCFDILVLPTVRSVCVGWELTVFFKHFLKHVFHGRKINYFSLHNISINTLLIPFYWPNQGQFPKNN